MDVLPLRLGVDGNVVNDHPIRIPILCLLILFANVLRENHPSQTPNPPSIPLATGLKNRSLETVDPQYPSLSVSYGVRSWDSMISSNLGFIKQ